MIVRRSAMGIDSKSDNDMIAKQVAERRLADELRQQERDHFEGSVLRQMHIRRKAAESKAKARQQKDSSASGSSCSSSEGEQKEGGGFDHGKSLKPSDPVGRTRFRPKSFSSRPS